MKSLRYRTAYYDEEVLDLQMDLQRHWCPQSELYAGGDVLACLLLDGWRIDCTVYRTYSELSTSRVVTIYEFTVFRQGQQMVLPVICNPYVRRVIRQLRLNVCDHIEEQEAALTPVR